MSLAIVALWLANLALDTAGQITFKAGAARSARSGGTWRGVAADPLMYLGVGCYCVEFVTWLAFLSLVPLSVAVLLASVNIITVTAVGRVVFRERGGWLRAAGIASIAAGVAIVGWGAQ